MTLIQYINGSLPSPCEFGLVCATGVIGTVENNYQGHWLESANSMNQEILSFFCGREKRERRLTPCCWRPRTVKESGSQNQEELSQNTVSSQREGVSTRSQNSTCCSSSEATDTGVNTNEKRSSVGYSIEVEQNSTSLGQSDAISLLLIPHHPGVQLKFFHICDEKFLKEYVSIFA